MTLSLTIKSNINPFTAMLAAPSLGNRPMKIPNLKSLRLISSAAWAPERTSIKTYSIESRFVIGPSDILFAGMHVCTFQPANFTGWRIEGVKMALMDAGVILVVTV